MKTRPLAIALALALGALFCLAPAAGAADKPKAEELERAMRFEAPLAEADLRLYLANLPAIFSLRGQPDKAAETAAAIPGWTQNRFAYVTTKMAVGLSLLLRPDDARTAAVPAFAKPTAQEMALIKSHQDEVVKALEALSGANGAK